MRLLSTAFAAVVVCLLFSEETNGLQCRSGFNSSIYGIPIQLWNPSTECSTLSAQACFLGELSYNVNFLTEKLSLTYGSCISQAYQSALECESLFGPNPSFDINQLSTIIPDINNQLIGAIDKFSFDTAEEFIKILQNENGELDDANLLESFLTATGVTPPDNVKPVLTKLDTLLLTALLNVSQVGKAAEEFLLSFNSLGTPDTSASTLLLKLFSENNIAVPSNFQPMIDNLPGFISQFVEDDLNFKVLNKTLYGILSGLASASTNPQSISSILPGILNQFVPPEYNLSPFFDALPNLVDELVKGNFDYVTQWNLDVMKSYSRITDATEALSTSILNLLQRFGVNETLPDELQTLIKYQPGYFYNFIPVEYITQLETVYFNISSALDSIDLSSELDIQQLLKSFGVDSLPDQLMSTLNGLLNVATTGNITAFGQYSLEALKEVSVVTAESLQMSASITAFLEKLNVTLPDEVNFVIKYVPGVLIASFPESTAMINTVFMNISDNLDKTDVTNPDYMYTSLEDSLAPLLMLNLTTEMRYFLEQIPSKINVSDPVGTLEDLIALVPTVIPADMNTVLPLLIGLPELLKQLMEGNINYLNTWQLELLKASSKNTTATENLSNSIFDLMKRFGIYNNLTDEIKTLIIYQPGYYYMFFIENPEYLDMIYGNLTEIINSIDPTKTIDVNSILAMISPQIDLSGMENLISMVEGFIETAMSGDANAIGLYGLEALKNSSVLTTESIMLSNSITAFFGKYNLTIPSPLDQVITYFPGIFPASFPQNISFINTLFFNISQGLDNTDVTTSTPDLNQIVNSTLQQLQMLGLILPPDLEKLLANLPANINASDPVATYAAILEIMEIIVPAEYQILPILQAVPDLLNQLVQGNYTYIKTWQVNLLGLYSTFTPSTVALTNSITQFLTRFGIYSDLPEDIKTLIEYQPGYFYQMFNQTTEDLDNTYYYISEYLDTIDPTSSPDLEAILKGISENIDLTGMDMIIGTSEEFLQAVLTGNATVILEKTVEILKNMSQLTTNSLNLSNTVIGLVELIINGSLPTDVSNIITYAPGIFTAFFPEQADMINMIYERITKGIADSASSTFDVEQTINDAISQLEMANVTIPTELRTLFDNLPSLFASITSNNETEIDQWFKKVLPLISPAGTTESAILSNAIKHVVYQVEGVPESEGLNAIIEHLPRIPYQAFSEQKAALDAVYQSIADSLIKINLTNSDSMFPGNMLAYFDISMIPAELVPFLNSTEDLIMAIVTNNDTLWIDWANYITSQYCVSNDVTLEFGNTFFDQINQYGEKMPEIIKAAFECIPGSMYMFFPNQTQMLNEVFNQIILSTTNYTAYIDLQFKKMNQTNPPDLSLFLEKLQELQTALMNGNITELQTLLMELGNVMVKETELSKLIETILTKFGVNVTDEMRMPIQQSSGQVYNPALQEYFSTFDTIFSSLNVDIAAGTDIGVAIKDAFSKANVEIYDRLIPVIDNLQLFIDAIVSNDGNQINQAVLSIMESYNASFTSDQVQYSIYQFKLQLVLMNLEDSNIPEIAFEYMANMYKLILKMFQTTEVELKSMLLTTFPDAQPFIEIFFTFDPKEALSFTTDFITWLTDENRNATTLASHIQSAIHLLLDRYDISVSSLLDTLIQPIACKYDSCATDGCNRYELIENMIPVTPTPEETDATIETTEPTNTTESLTTTSTAKPVTTTSGQVISPLRNFSWGFLLASTILSAKWVAS